MDFPWSGPPLDVVTQSHATNLSVQGARTRLAASKDVSQDPDLTLQFLGNRTHRKLQGFSAAPMRLPSSIAPCCVTRGENITQF